METSGPVCVRAARAAGATWWAVVAVSLLVTAVTFQVQPQVTENFTTWQRGTVFPLLALAGAAGVKFEFAKKDKRKAYFCLVRLSDLNANECRVGVYPVVLPACNPVYSLTATSAKVRVYGLKIGLVWWIIGIILAAGYFAFLYRSFAGKVVVDANRHGSGK